MVAAHYESSGAAPVERDFAMIDDMAALKQAMEQMDAYDDAVAQAAKDSAARILSDAKLSFSKLAELIEQRRLLLSPKIVASIKRMDQPDMLGDSPFHEARYALRREGQSFRQIAEALEPNGGAAPALLHPIEMESEPAALGWLLYPLQHPVRFLVIALLAFMLFNTLRGFVGLGRQVSGHVADVSAARSGADATQSSASSSATPSAGSAAASAPAASAPAPSATAPAPATSAAVPLTLPPAAPAGAAPSTPNIDAKGAFPSNSAANDRLRMVQRALEDRTLAGLRRNSRLAGPCIHGAGGCYWGGGRY
jgi:hypothetical protein